MYDLITDVQMYKPFITRSRFMIVFHKYCTQLPEAIIFLSCYKATAWYLKVVPILIPDHHPPESSHRNRLISELPLYNIVTL